MQKVVVFGQVSKLLRALIKSRFANFGESDKSFCQQQFWCKNDDFEPKNGKFV